jgi:predicted PurR-regulated permease PerM
VTEKLSKDAGGNTPVDVVEPAAPAVHLPARIGSVSLVVLAGIAVVFVLSWAKAVIIPLMLALMISYALSAPVKLMQKWHIPRSIGAAFMLLAIIGGVGSAVYALSDDAGEWIETLPAAANKLRLALQKDRNTSANSVEHMQRAVAQLEQAASETGDPASAVPSGVTRVQVEKPRLDVKEYLWMGTKGAFGFAAQLSMVIFLAYFIIVSGDRFRRKIVRIAGPALSKKKITLQVLDEITEQIRRFLLVQIFTSILVGVVTWLAFLWIGLEHAAIWGIAAGVCNVIPYLGPIIISGGTALVAFLQFGTISMVLLVAGISLLITSLEGYLLTPWITGRASRMNPLVVFVGVLFWGWLWGVWGLLLGVPIIMVIKAVCDRTEELRAVGELLGE